MNYPKDVILLKRNGWIMAGILSLILLLGFFWNWHQMDKRVHNLALDGLKLSFERDVVYRLWAAKHGGVYVPVSEHTPPNPNLSHIPERDITTPSGIQLTIVNPAYMTRQVYELGKKRYDIQGKITSLNPLRPENIPDEWEKQALKSFAEGAKQAVVVMDMDGSPYMRLMKPFVTEESCLKCHGHQGYNIGNILGGISVSTPLASYLAHIKSRQISLLLGHTIIWIFGVLFIGITTSRMVAIRRDTEKERENAEKSLKQSEEKYRALIEQSMEMVFLHDLNGNFLDLNKAAAKKTQYNKEELLNLNVFDLHPDKSDRNDILRQWKSWNQGQHITLETLHMSKDGNVYPVEVTTGKISVGNKDYILALVRDITERRCAESAIKKSHQRVLTVLNNINAIVYVVDMETYDILFVNQFVLDKCGDVQGKKCWDVIHSDQSGPCGFCTNKKLVDVEANPTGIYRWEFNNERTGKWYDCHDSAIKWIDDRVVRLQIAIDITKRKQAEEALKSNYALLHLAGKTAKFGGWSINLAENKVFWSDEVAAIHEMPSGYSPLVSDGINFYAPEWQGKITRVFNDCAQEGIPYDEEMEIITAKGRRIWVRTTGEAVRDENANIVKVHGSFQDINEHKEMERQLLQAQKMESVGRLAGGVAHDYNNMLLVIMGYAELGLESFKPNEPIYEFFEEIFIASKRSADITQKLLAFARKQTISPKVCDLNELVEGMLKMLRRLIGEDIDLASFPEAQMWPVKIDPSQVDQILANLCVNARDAISGVGKITIETKKTVFDKEYCSRHVGFVPGEFVMLAISDNGCGMDRETLDNIFDPFFTTKSKGKGTGLGLATFYGIVKQNHGFINVYSEPGNGTTIKIYLPRHYGQVEEIMDKTSQHIPSGHGETILLVEDEKTIINIGKMTLESLGYLVLTAGTPAEALSMAKKHSGNICLLITDVIMPEMNGRDLAQHLSSLCPNIKTLFMSGYTANVIAHHGVLDEGVHFIQKPFSKKDIAVKIKELLEQS